jgi:Fe-S-cluster containining protein
MSKASDIVKKVGLIYEQIDLKTGEESLCQACGCCCDFKTYEHRLFITTPELLFFKERSEGEAIKPMTDGLCPYNISGKCTVYQRRFVGCRIFCCEGDADAQSELSEWAVEEFKNLCEKHGLQYRYMELSTALNGSGD